MRVFLINSSKMTGDPLTFPGGGSHDPQTTIDILDRRALSDGFPFLIEDDGRTRSCASANQYFLDALDQRAFRLAGMTNLAHSFNKFLTTIRRKRAADAASAVGQNTQEWLSAHGEPHVDLTDVTREDLIYYRDTQQLEIAPSTLAGELQRLSSFFIYARSNPGPYQLITSRLFVDAERFPRIVELRARAMDGVIDLIIAVRDPGMDRPTAKFLGVSMWSLLHGHLMLNNDSSGLLDSQATLDDEIARLATHMAQLPVPSPSLHP